MFTRADLRDVVKHDNDLVVISVVATGRKVHRVLVDCGSSADVMFWSTFNKCSCPLTCLDPTLDAYMGSQGTKLRCVATWS